jgi:hypothetical protein
VAGQVPVIEGAVVLVVLPELGFPGLGEWLRDISRQGFIPIRM